LKGPKIRAVIETNPSALSQAAALDRERSLIGKRGPLHGIPVLLKVSLVVYYICPYALWLYRIILLQCHWKVDLPSSH
jgi:hypothetical protein